MKKLFITAVIATMFSVTAFADGGKKTSTETGENNVSYSALTQFKSDFENASNVVWIVTSTSQSVSFTQNNAKYTAYYDWNGQFWGLAQDVTLATITKPAKQTIAKEYSGYDVANVTRFEAQDGEEAVVYFVKLKNATSEIVATISPVDGEIKNIDTIK